jgi:membrane-bound metal-dependent hydrolase YbcI (DUF457 family)
MDNLTHTLTGVAMARAGLSRRFGPGTTLLLALASNLPDVDAVLMLAGPQAALARRTLTHSVVGVPLLSLGLALLFRWRRKDASLASLFGLTLLGAGVHVFMDLLNSYSVVLFYPLSLARFELAWTYIIDLTVWAILFAPFLLRVIPRIRRHDEMLFRGCVVALSLYLGLCGLAHLRATNVLDRIVAQAGMRPDFTAVFPEAKGPHRFRGVARQGDEYHAWLLHLVDGTADLYMTAHTDADLPDVQAVRSRPEAQRIERFFKAPVWKRVPERGVAEVWDLRFTSAVLTWRRDNPFVYTFPLEAHE